MRFTAQAMQLCEAVVQHCVDEMLQAGRSLGGRFGEVLPSCIQDVNVDLVRRLISTALGLLIRRLCSAASLDAADENLAIHERGLEKIRIRETAELQNRCFRHAQSQDPRAVTDRDREPQALAISGADVQPRGRMAPGGHKLCSTAVVAQKSSGKRPCARAA